MNNFEAVAQPVQPNRSRIGRTNCSKLDARCTASSIRSRGIPRSAAFSLIALVLRICNGRHGDGWGNGELNCIGAAFATGTDDCACTRKGLEMVLLGGMGAFGLKMVCLGGGPVTVTRGGGPALCRLLGTNLFRKFYVTLNS